jgi:hypothetical protein
MSSHVFGRGFLYAVLFSASVSASAAEPEMFVRGAFNGWGIDDALIETSKDHYEAKILIAPGNHGFKLGSRDWSAEWVINPAESVTIVPGQGYEIDRHPGAQDFLFVKSTATYRFALDLSTKTSPQLRVTREDAATSAPLSDPHAGNRSRRALRFATHDGRTETATFSTPNAAAPMRSYVQSTTMSLRDPGPQFVRYQESKLLPVVRSGDLAFDALFAMAASEMQQASVSHIKDGNYNGGAAIACECFETGEKWHYVWTRDLSYAADLGLAMLDPQRVRNSLEFKLSPLRAGIKPGVMVPANDDALQIIQDTGSGGSWPVSTDRISWAFGAEQVLATLPAAERAEFAERALKALTNTIENDRLAAFDQHTGLYTGEQSFLDWREQSYASWIVDDIASLASTKALSTNVAHYKGLTLAARLAHEQGDTKRADRYAAWALALKHAINEQLWLEDEGMYSSLSAGHFDGAPLHKFDWLGQSLAIITGVADASRAATILAHYPHGPMGPPVIYPQQMDQPIYHNRAIWPFVTAYGLRAAAVAGNVSVADAAYRSLMRGAALNLSNMENLEWLSGQPLLLDEQHPSLIGPVINSKRQLWSVGAYLGTVIGRVFGISATGDGIKVQPFITGALRREAFAHSKRITLHRLRLQGRELTVNVELPPASTTDGFYPVRRILLDGRPASATIGWQQLGPRSVVTVELGPLRAGDQRMRRVDADPYQQDRRVFAPRDPMISSLRRDGTGHLVLSFADAGADTTYNIYRNGKPAASGIHGTTWTDGVTNGACYAIEAQSSVSMNRSHHSAPACSYLVQEIAVTDARVASTVAPAPADTQFALARIKDWGREADALTVKDVAIARPGSYQLQVRYHNRANQINLGISGGVKWLAVRDAAGHVVARGVVQMPHARLANSNTPTVLSTPLAAKLAAGAYTLSLSDFYNMSYLHSNASFSAAGGVDGPSNRVDIFGIRIMETE